MERRWLSGEKSKRRLNQMATLWEGTGANLLSTPRFPSRQEGSLLSVAGFTCTECAGGWEGLGQNAVILTPQPNPTWRPGCHPHLVSPVVGQGCPQRLALVFMFISQGIQSPTQPPGFPAPAKPGFTERLCHPADSLAQALHEPGGSGASTCLLPMLAGEAEGVFPNGLSCRSMSASSGDRAVPGPRTFLSQSLEEGPHGGWESCRT